LSAWVIGYGPFDPSRFKFRLIYIVDGGGGRREGCNTVDAEELCKYAFVKTGKTNLNIAKMLKIKYQCYMHKKIIILKY